MPSYASLWPPELGYSKASSPYRMGDWEKNCPLMVFAFKERLFSLLSKIAVTQEGYALTAFFTLSS